MPTTSYVDLLSPQVTTRSLPAVLTIAGLDSSGGAGIEADIKTINAHEVYGLTCIAALTAQNTSGVEAVEKTPIEHLRKILKKNFDDFIEGYDGDHPLKVVKTGMLTEEAATVLSENIDYLNKNGIKIVMDPVMVSTSGVTLTNNKAVQLCFDKIFPSTFLCTPNFVEALLLYEAKQGKAPEVSKIADVEKLTVELQKILKCNNILLKGGHIPWTRNGELAGEKESGDLVIADVLYEKDADKITIFRSPYIVLSNTHGTGCTLASSIASNIAKGLSLQGAIPLSINYVHTGMLTLASKLGHGHGPVDHTNAGNISFQSVIKGSSTIGRDLKEKHGDILAFFTNHPLIKENWRRYVEHPFVELVATNKLPFEKFLFYLKQDFYYLINYAQIHGLAALVAPSYKQIHAQAEVIDSIMKELERHKIKLLKKYNVDFDRAELDSELQPAKPCLAYCDYLLRMGKTQDFPGIKVALAPCLHGYADAGIFGKALRKKHDGSLGVLSSEDESNTYASWLDDYTSDWYNEANELGKKVLDDIVTSIDLSEQRLEELVTIFNDVTKLEIAFWDEITESLK